MKTKIFKAKLKDLKPTENNPRQISKDDFRKLKKSLQEFPEMEELREIVVDEDMRILGGHQRVKALLDNGETEATVKQAIGLTEEQKAEFVIKDNVLSGEFDFDELADSWSEYPLDEWGAVAENWSNDQTEYQDFVDKFKPKLTTDDCYTPPEVFAAVEEWVREKFDLGDAENIRPFKPNGDYQAEDYSSDKVVIDNPPFSILSKIIKWYSERGIKFFLFAPHLTILSGVQDIPVTRVIVGANVIYENGASVTTSFVTNMAEREIAVMVSGSLRRRIEDSQPMEAADLERYVRPKNLKVGTDLAYAAKNGRDWEIMTHECEYIRNADGLKKLGKSLYGGGLLVSDSVAEKAAAEKAAAEKAAAEKAAVIIELSEREKAIIGKLNGGLK